MYKIVTLVLTVLLVANANAEKLESIFVAPDVFITSKIKPSTEYESDRGNILYDSHELEKADNTLLVRCSKIYQVLLHKVWVTLHVQ